MSDFNPDEFIKHHLSVFSRYNCDFTYCVVPVLELEGGLCANGGLHIYGTDRGGQTKYGISQSAFPHLDIKNLTLDQAVRIYHFNYWKPVRAIDLPDGVDFIVFDAAVNQGVFAAVHMLQRLVDTKPDGLMGPKTLKAVYQFNPLHLIACYALMRERRYKRLIQQDPTQIANLKGWENRLDRVLDYAFQLAEGL